ncbi:MAG: hypothetical protein AAGF15_03495, partial [Pseudomonadota bacterium]
GKADPTNAIRTGSMTEGNHVQRVASAPKTPNQNRLFQQNQTIPAICRLQVVQLSLSKFFIHDCLSEEVRGDEHVI